MKIKNNLLKLMVFCAVFGLLVPMNVFAKTQSNMIVNIGEKQIDVTQLAEDNGVDPYELRDAIIKGYHADKASPFSDLKTETPNTRASETITFEAITEPRANGARAIATKSNQDSTAYVAKAGALTASGKTPEVGMCAMHIDVTTKTGETTDSMVKLGKKISMTNPVKINGSDYTELVVEDRGAPTNRTKFWIDVYFGEKTDTTYNAAIKYGVQTVSYTYSY